MATRIETEIQEQIQAIVPLVDTDLIAAGEQAAAIVENHPDSLNARMFLGFIYNHQRNVEGAIKCLEAAHRLAPKNDAVLFNLGVSFSQLGDLERALEYYKAATDLAPPGNHQSLVLMGLTEHRLGRPSVGIPIFRQVVEAQPADASAIYCLIQALRETGSFVEADLWADRLSAMIAKDEDVIRKLLLFLQGYDFAGWIDVDDKARLAEAVNDYRRNVDPESFDSMPQTFVMPHDYEAMRQAHREEPGIWIAKPNNMHNGHGLRLSRNPEDTPREDGWLVQRYLEDPFLFRGRKASFRLNMVVTSTNPPRIYLFHGGSVRFALEEYDKDLANLDELERHIGHYAIFSDRKDLVEKTAQLMGNAHSVWRFPELTAYIQEAGFNMNQIWPEIEKIAGQVAQLIDHIGIFERQSIHGTRYA